MTTTTISCLETLRWSKDTKWNDPPSYECLDNANDHLYISIVQFKLRDDMDTIAVSELRANLMKVLKKVERGEVVDVASRGKVVARIVPPDHIQKKAMERLKELRKTAILKDVISPIDIKWDALDDNA